MLKRTHECGSLRLKDAESDVVLCGWVQRRRDHGGLIFVDLRDRSGLVQIVFNPQVDEITHAKARNIRNEYCINVAGKIKARPKGTENPNLPTGEIEVVVNYLEILNPSKTPPFIIDDDTGVGEDIRLRYRYLDLRRPTIQKNLILRHKVCQVIRRCLDSKGFLEIETPFLIKSTPEGARDYIVPSRVNPGKFFALPQSPQLFKQILMVSGFEKYFQIVRCFRDEDLRADRQPEFTQIDMELSFVDEENIFEVCEDLMKEIFKASLGIEIKTPFERIIYSEAIDRFGSDKPDVRFGMELVEVTDEVKECEFKVFRNIIEKGGLIKGIKVPQGASFSRGEIDELTSLVSIYGAKGLAYFRVKGGELESPISKFFTPQILDAIKRKFQTQEGDLLLFVADKPKIVNESLGNLRLILGQRLDLIPKEGFYFTWVVDYPLFEYNEEEKRLVSNHHPFTSPKDTDYHLLDTAPEKVKARAYDLILNGIEIGGGSIRIHRKDIQEKVFKILGISPKESMEKFGFLLEALEYGAPPHGGIAFGLDRLLRIIIGSSTIRDVIAFPKTQSTTCPMTGAPFEVEHFQLSELKIKLDLKDVK
jgi:aspartyl-tRNA synthetase